MKTKITFELRTPTSVKVMHDGNHVGNIWSESDSGGTPYPHNEELPTLEKIQICGFADISEVWSCGVFHGTKDVCVRFNPMMDDYYKGYQKEYQRYIDACFKKNVPQLIKPFNDWVKHMGYPKAEDVKEKKK